MAQPRNSISHKDVNPKRQLSFYADGTTIVYDKTKVNGHRCSGWGAVKISADGIVSMAGDNDPVNGSLILVEADGACTVRTEGVFHFRAGNAAVFYRGYGVVGAVNASAETGYVKGVNPATATVAQLAAAFGRVGETGDTSNIAVHTQ